MDWTRIPYAVDKGVLFPINPDAHSTRGIDDNLYGTWAARKGGLPLSHCLNAMECDDFEEWLEDQHAKR